MQMPSIDTMSNNAPVTELDVSSKQNIDDILAMMGLSGQSATTGNENKSGVSKAYDMEELELMRLDDKDILRDFEVRLYEVVKAIYNYRSTGTKLQDGLKFVCDFIEQVTPLNESDKIAKWKFELEQGLSSKVDYLISENPELETEQAIKILTENVKLKEQFKTEEPKPAGNNPTDKTNDTGTGFNDK